MNLMKKILRDLLFISAGLFFIALPRAQAHDLIPQAVIDYVQSHPNATPAEIEAFAEATVPAYAEKFPNGEKIFLNLA
jgi:phosphoribosylanthranilate isomerase